MPGPARPGRAEASGRGRLAAHPVAPPVRRGAAAPGRRHRPVARPPRRDGPLPWAAGAGLPLCRLQPAAAAGGGDPGPGRPHPGGPLPARPHGPVLGRPGEREGPGPPAPGAPGPGRAVGGRQPPACLLGTPGPGPAGPAAEPRDPGPGAGCLGRAGPDCLLHRLQHDIFHLTGPDRRGAGVLAPDASLQVQVCHSPLRECQVLHDWLLGPVRGRART